MTRKPINITGDNTTNFNTKVFFISLKVTSE